MTLMCSRNDTHSIPVVAYAFEPGILSREGGITMKKSVEHLDQTQETIK